MAGGKQVWWLGLALAVMLSASCAGMLTQLRNEDGSEERLRVQGGDRWSSWDRNPRKEDGFGIMLKKESTF
jgi:hypothetical protein